MSEAEKNDLVWKSDDGSTVEIRFQGRLGDGRPALDEVVATGADAIWSRWTGLVPIFETTS
jgi:hypothetical protein